MRWSPLGSGGTRYLVSAAIGITTLGILAGCDSSRPSPTGVAATTASTQLFGRSGKEGTAWVSNGGQADGVGSLSLVSTETIGVEATLPLTGYPLGVSATPDGRLIYATSFVSGIVSVYDATTRQLLGTTQLPGSPNKALFSPDGKLAYVPNIGSNVSVIDTHSNTIVGTLNMPNGSLSAAITPDGRFLYVTDIFDDGVSVVNTATKTVVGEIPLTGGGASGIAITPDGQSAFVEDYTDVAVINTKTNAVVATIPSVGTCGPEVFITPDGKRAYALDYCNSQVLVIDVQARSLVTTLSAANPIGAATTQGGANLYLLNNNCPSFPCTAFGFVQVLATATNQVLNTVTVGFNPQDVAITNKDGDDELLAAGPQEQVKRTFSPSRGFTGERVTVRPQGFVVSRRPCVACRTP